MFYFNWFSPPYNVHLCMVSSRPLRWQCWSAHAWEYHVSSISIISRALKIPASSERALDSQSDPSALHKKWQCCLKWKQSRTDLCCCLFCLCIDCIDFHTQITRKSRTATCYVLPQVEAEPNWSLRSAGTEVGGEHHRQQFLRLGRGSAK